MVSCCEEIKGANFFLKIGSSYARNVWWCSVAVLCKRVHFQ